MNKYQMWTDEQRSCYKSVCKIIDSDIKETQRKLNWLLKYKKDLNKIGNRQDTMRRKYDNAIKCGGVCSTPAGDLSHSGNKLRGEGN